MGKKKVCKITQEEYNSNEDKYIELGLTEKVIVTKNNKTFFTLNKRVSKGLKELKSFYGLLPKSAYDELYSKKQKEN